jgi:hypothetical protein
MDTQAVAILPNSEELVLKFFFISDDPETSLLVEGNYSCSITKIALELDLPSRVKWLGAI